MSDHPETKEQAHTDEIAALSKMPHADLRFTWRRLYRAYPPKFLNRDLLELGVAWKIQERAFGGHSATTKRQLVELAKTIEDKSDIAKARRAALRPGSRLIREWRGETHEVLVTEDGYLWRDKSWRSLSVIAREMTGTRWSGPRFFGLDRSVTQTDIATQGQANE